jgi:hypothetical protein
MRHACSWIVLSVLFLQTCHGTSIVWVVSKTGEYVVLATDSRDFDPITGKSDDTVCKVIALDDTLFFNSGDVRLRTRLGEPWESLQTAREIYKGTKDHDAQSLSITWGQRAKTWFDRQIPPVNQSVVGPDGGLVTGGFINFDQHRNPAVFVEELFFNPATQQPFLTPTSPIQIGMASIQPPG